jgi:hypothetical protein
MILSDTDRREVCEVHGWVGRRAFQRDRHDLCAESEETEPDVEDGSEDAADDRDAKDDHADEDEDEEEIMDLDEEDETPRWGRAEARRRGIPPKKTVAARRITKLELQVGRAELKVLGADEPYDRPKTRGECHDGPRPCPYVACKFNLYLDVSETGSLIFNFPHLTPNEMRADQSCSLDLADRGGMTLEEIAVVTNLTRERIRQVELKTLIRRARPAALSLGLRPEDAADAGMKRGVGPGADLAETGVDGEVPSDVATILAGSGGGNGNSNGNS